MRLVQPRVASAPSRPWWLAVFGAVAALAAGTATALQPAVGLGLAGVLAAATMAVAFAEHLPRAYLVAAGGVLFGYTFLGKGFAYLGVAPLYVGELLLMAGLATLAFVGGLGPVLRSPVAWAILAFGAWGAARTVPYISTDGLDALRDGIVWGYAAFALLVAAFVLRTRAWKSVVDVYGRWFWWFALWAPVAGVIFRVAESSIPRVPGAGDIPILFVKAGDFGVQLAGLATFVLLGLHVPDGKVMARRGRWRDWIFWSAWMGGLVIAGAASRGALLSVLVAVATVLLFRRRTGWWKPALIGAALLAVFVSSNVTIDVGQDRKVSARQLMTNVRSIFGETSNEGNLEGTRAWRLQWWSDIVGYTVQGPYFWTGKGFGVNLADDDGYQGTDRGIPNRHPHNIQMTVLAHAGVPGLALWLVLHALFAGSLLASYFRARRARLDWWARVDLWILSFWVAFMANAAFDVFLEGPQGGIWFWCLVGYGIAVMLVQRRLTSGVGRAVA